MFGYASDVTEDCLPLTHAAVTRLGMTLTDVVVAARGQDSGDDPILAACGWFGAARCGAQWAPFLPTRRGATPAAAGPGFPPAPWVPLWPSRPVWRPPVAEFWSPLGFR